MLLKQQACRLAGTSLLLAVIFFIQGCAYSTSSPPVIVTGSPVYDENSKASSSEASPGALACRSASSSQTNPLQKNESLPEQNIDSSDLEDSDCALSNDLGASDAVDAEGSSAPAGGQPAENGKSHVEEAEAQNKKEELSNPPAISPPEESDSNPVCESDENCADKGLGVATGTGFFISEKGFLVTNAHVVAESVELYILYNDETLPASIILTDEENDLALLKVEMESPRLALQNIEPLKGDEVAVIGFPNVVVMGNAVKATFGHVNASSGPVGDERYLQFDASIQPGNSGSPVVDTSGAVVGVATASLNQATALRTSGSLAQNVNYAVKADYLLPLISVVPDWILAPEVPAQELSTTEVAAKVEASVVLIINVHDGSSDVQAERKKDGRQDNLAEGADAFDTPSPSEELSQEPLTEGGSESGSADEIGPDGVASEQNGSESPALDPQNDPASSEVEQADKESASRPRASRASGTGTWYLYKERGDND